MAKTAVEEKICDACGADVRAGSLFCYHCGGPLGDAPKASVQVSDAWLKGDLVAESDLKTTRLDQKKVLVEEPDEEKSVAESEQIEAKSETPKKSDEQLKSAAGMRRKAKSFQRKTTEIVWEEPDTAPNKWFPLVAVLLILLVVGIFYVAMYLR